MFLNLSSLRGVLSTFRDLILADIQPLVNTYDALAKASEDDQDDWGCDYDVIRDSWGARVAFYVDLARKTIDREQTEMEQGELMDIANSLDLMRECWNKTSYFIDDDGVTGMNFVIDIPDTTHFLEKISSILRCRSSRASVKPTKVATDTVAEVVAEAVIDAATDTIPSAKKCLSNAIFSPQLTETAKAVANPATGMTSGADKHLGDDSLSPQSGRNTFLPTSLGYPFSSSPMLVMGKPTVNAVISSGDKSGIDGQIAEISAIPTPNNENELEEFTENYVAECMREEKRVGARPSEMKEEREKNGHQWKHTTTSVKSATQTKAEKPQQNHNGSSSLSSSKESLVAEKRTTIRRETDMSLCDAPASDGHRDSIRRLFQSRIVQVSDQFLRGDRNSSSQNHRSFDFDDFANELEAWLVIIRAKNYGEKDVFSPASNPDPITAATFFDSAVVSPAANEQGSI